MTDLDLDDPRLFLREDVLDDPRAFYDRLRRDAPVWQIPGQDSYLVSDPVLIREAVGRPADFSSNLVSVLHADGTGCPVAFGMARYRDPVFVLSTADPPLHAQHRRLLMPHFSPASVAALEPVAAGIVDEYLAPILAGGPVDFVRDFADPVPVRTIAAFIGLADPDVGGLIDTVAATGALLDGITDRAGIDRAAGSALELTVLVNDALQQALAAPESERQGLLAVFAAAVEAGAITADEVRDMLVVLVSAGSETTASLLATAAATLAGDPALQDRLRRDPAQIPAAIEAILRADGPFQFHYRWTPEATTLGGVAIPAHSRVLLMWAAANRPAPDEHEDDPSSASNHFAFGKGLHFCIGAPVARLEARVALERLLAGTTAITLDPGQAPTRRPSVFIRRLRSLPLVIA
jgi:cytochrome P450 family 144